MKLLTLKNTEFKNQLHGHLAIPDSKLLLKNIVGSFMILTLSILAIVLLLFPKLSELVKGISSSRLVPATLLAGTLLVCLLFAIPLSWFVQSLVNYRNASSIDRMGIMVKGSILDKWVDESNDKLVYYVRYKYSVHLNARQAVDRDIFQQLNRDESVFVLHLEDLPHISRLDLG
jgi:hypothetical protein